MTVINYKNWAFRFIIWIIIINVAAFWVTTNYNSLVYDQSQISKKLWMLGNIYF